MNNLFELPEGWTISKLENLVHILDNQRIPVNSQEREKKKGNIPYYGATGQVGWIDDFIFDEELVLLGEDGAPFLDKSKPIAYIISGKSWVNNHAHVLRVIEEFTSNKFIKYFLDFFDFSDFVTGSTRLKLNQSLMRKIPVTIPPLAEQEHIVAKVQALLARVNAARERLEKVPVILKRFRQSVLAAACSGRLTEEWRENKRNLTHSIGILKEIEKEKIIEQKKKNKNQITFQEHTIIETWAYAKLENLIYIAGRIGWRGLKAEEYTKDGPLLLSVHSLNYGEYVRFDDADHISIERYKESPEIMLNENDILLCKDGAGIGKIAIVKNLSSEATVNSSLLVIRGGKAFLPKFLYYFLSGPEMQTLVKSRITGSSTPHLFQKDIKEFWLSIPPLEEQHEIVRRVEALFKLADTIESQVKAAKDRVDKLTQSILAKAFRGELVPIEAKLAQREGREYETAAELLERILS